MISLAKYQKNVPSKITQNSQLGIQPHWQNEKYWVKSLRVIPHSWRSKGRVFSKASEWHILLNNNMVMKKAKRKLPSSRRKWSHSIFFKTINIFCLIRECLRANVFTAVNSVLHSLVFAFFFFRFILFSNFLQWACTASRRKENQTNHTIRVT